jgi:ATP-dependent exoDNAse (exonuclease V) beta subunit
VTWRHPVTGKGRSDSAHRAAMEDLKRREEAEENRLLYVAMTRAEQRLILSYAERPHSSRWRKMAEASVSQMTAADRIPDPPSTAGRVTETVPEEWVDPPRADEQHDSAAAVTSVALFQACPRRYYLSRYLGLEPENEGPGTGAIALGLEVHALLAGATAGSAEAREIAQRFRESAIGRRSARATRVEREFDFLLYLEDIVLRGQIDLWFEESGELVLADYKTGADESAAPEHALQLRLYALALERYAGRLPDRAILCYLRSDHYVDVSMTPEELDAAREAARALVRAQDSLIFPLRTGEQCRRCAFFRNLCPADLA